MVTRPGLQPRRLRLYFAELSSSLWKCQHSREICLHVIQGCTRLKNRPVNYLQRGKFSAGFNISPIAPTRVLSPLSRSQTKYLTIYLRPTLHWGRTATDYSLSHFSNSARPFPGPEILSLLPSPIIGPLHTKEQIVPCSIPQGHTFPS